MRVLNGLSALLLTFITQLKICIGLITVLQIILNFFTPIKFSMKSNRDCGLLVMSQLILLKVEYETVMIEM